MRLQLFVGDGEASAEAQLLLARSGLMHEIVEWDLTYGCLPVLLVGDPPYVTAWNATMEISLALAWLTRMRQH